MDKKANHNKKNRFSSLQPEKQLEIIGRYVDKYHGNSTECLIDWALRCGLAGQLVSNDNYQF